MKQSVSFLKLKLTNNTLDQHGHVSENGGSKQTGEIKEPNLQNNQKLSLFEKRLICFDWSRIKP